MKPDAKTYQRAGRLRRTLTPPEARLWRHLKGSALADLKFRRQHPVGPYILDFYCPAARLAVEIDGRDHEIPERLARDRARTSWLETQGIKVVRFAAPATRDHLEEVLRAIRETAQARLP